METKKVLLVDDDIDIITVAKAILTKEGFEVYTASNKIEGLKKAKEVMPDIAVLDVMMTTYFEGFELAKGFKDDEQLKRIPVVIQSSIDVLISSDYSVIDMAKNMRAQAQYKELDVLLIKDITTGKGGIDYRTNDNKSHWVEVEGFMKKPIESNILLNTINKILKNS
jgi:CheY-like chemotaxis protein